MEKHTDVRNGKQGSPNTPNRTTDDQPTQQPVIHHDNYAEGLNPDVDINEQAPAGLDSLQKKLWLIEHKKGVAIDAEAEREADATGDSSHPYTTLVEGVDTSKFAPKEVAAPVADAQPANKGKLLQTDKVVGEKKQTTIH